MQESCIKWSLTRTHPVCQFCDMIFMKEGVMTHVNWRWRDYSSIACLCSVACLQRWKQIKEHVFFSSQFLMGIGQIYMKIQTLLVRNWLFRLKKNFSHKETQLFFPPLDKVNCCSFITVMFNYCNFTTRLYWMGKLLKALWKLPSSLKLAFPVFKGLGKFTMERLGQKLQMQFLATPYCLYDSWPYALSGFEIT